jgi:hypothetical protein
MEKEKFDQLCWDCKKACGGEKGCPWFNGNIPIENWTAVPTITEVIEKDGEFEPVHSYHITKCPLFEREERIERKTDRVFAEEIGISVRTYYRKKRSLKKLKALGVLKGDCSKLKLDFSQRLNLG